MPYIKSGDGRRKALQKGNPAQNAGELNYQIFYHIKNSHYNIKTVKLMIQDFVNNFLGDKPNYQRYNDMTGCLIRCGKEIRRRLDKSNPRYREIQFILYDIMESYDDEIAKYEDKKIIENGDVEV